MLKTYLTIGAAVSTFTIAFEGPVYATPRPAVVHRIAPAPMPAGNPLKGFIAYGAPANFPHSMEWFSLPVNAVQASEHTFDWTAFEAKLNEAAGRGNQACFRFYYDYPHEPTGIPAYLLEPGEAQLPRRAYTDYGGGQSPDYNGDSPGSIRFRQSMREFIAALGAKYDGDPRIGFITVGLLGFWGEWHTYPHEDWTPKDDVMNMVLNSFVSAFHKTRLQVRYPAANSPRLPVGFHDDAFCEETLYEHDWCFAARLRTAKIPDVWKRQPIGGEVMPAVQATLFPSGVGNTTGERWADCVKAVHPTWMLCNEIKTYKGKARAAAIQASTHMGYDLQVKTAAFGDIAHGAPFRLAVAINNDGIAPFYYRWDVLVGAKRGGRVIKTWKTDWDITRIPAGETRSFGFGAAGSHLLPGTYTLAVKVVNPMRGGKPLLFSNQGQNADGWLDLGVMRVM